MPQLYKQDYAKVIIIEFIYQLYDGVNSYYKDLRIFYKMKWFIKM